MHPSNENPWIPTPRPPLRHRANISKFLDFTQNCTPSLKHFTDLNLVGCETTLDHTTRDITDHWE